MASAPVILKPSEPVAERVLLPGDPGRALRLAQQLIDGPRMLNHHRGLWGYTGPAADGAPLTIQSTGLGGPSAAAVVRALIGLGARRLVRVGTAAGLGGTPPGTVVVVEAAIAADGVSRALGADARVVPDAGLAAALAGDLRGLVASTDVHEPAREHAWASEGAIAVDLATAAVLATAAHAGAAAGAILGITRTDGRQLPDDELAGLEAALGRAGAAALGAVAGT